MRIGKVRLDVKFEYVVDLDNRDMVSQAKDCLFEDLQSLHRETEWAFDELIVEEESWNLSESNIPDFLREGFEEEDLLADTDS